MSKDDESALSRWSRLKRDAGRDEAATAERDEDEAGPAPQVADPGGQPVPAASEQSGDAVPEIRPEDLPDVETLTYESDFTAFMQQGVPKELRRLALRKLWRSDPVLANVDGLNDYDQDYRAAMNVVDLAKEILLKDKEGKRDRWADVGNRDRPTGKPAEARGKPDLARTESAGDRPADQPDPREADDTPDPTSEGT